MCKESKMLDLLPTKFCFSGLLSCPELLANRPPCHRIIHSLCVSLSLMLLLLFSLSLSSEQVVIRAEPTRIPLSNPFSPPSVFSAKWGPCTLPPVHPLHCGPSRLLLKVLSFNHFFKKRFFFRAVRGHRSHQSCFPTQWPFNQAEVHFAAALFRPPFLPGAQGWSLWPRPPESHSYQSFRGGLGDLHQFLRI